MRYGQGDFQYELVEDWARLPRGWSFVDVGGISVDRDDNVYVLNRSEHPVIVFDREGSVINTWGEGFFKRAHGSCIAPDGSIFCTDDHDHVVAKFSLSGELQMMIGTRGQPSDTGYVHTWETWQSVSTIVRPGQPFNRPTGVAVSPNGEIYVSDGYGNSRVHRFNASGELMLSWGEPGGAAGQFRLPHDVALDDAGRVLVADRENSRIQVFDQDGSYLTQWHDVIRPTGLFIDSAGLAYVSELAMRVSVFSADGELRARWGNQTFDRNAALLHAPHAVAVDSHGDVYVGEVSATYARMDKGAHSIHKFRRVS